MRPEYETLRLDEPVPHVTVVTMNRPHALNAMNTQMMIDLRNVGLISASTRSQENDDLPPPDFPSNPEFQPDIMCSRQQMRTVLGDAMKTLPERYQKVVALYYTNEMTMKEIGGVLGINESRVSQIHKSALEKMP